MDRDKHLSRKQRDLWDYLLTKADRYGMILESDQQYLWKYSGFNKITFGILFKFLIKNKVIKQHPSGNYKIEPKNRKKYAKKELTITLTEYIKLGGGVHRIKADKVKYVGNNPNFINRDIKKVEKMANKAYKVLFGGYTIPYPVEEVDLVVEVKLGLSSEYLI